MTPSDFCKLVSSSKSPVLFYDIETRGADEGTLRELFKDEKIELPKHPGEFDPYRVKYGNIKDEAKKREKLQQVMEAHEQEVRNWEADCAKTQEEAWKKYVDQAALSSLTGRVCAVGYGLAGSLSSETAPTICLDVSLGDEEMLLSRFWYLIQTVGSKFGRVVSFNGHGFDLPFCRDRAWVHGLCPPDLVTKYNKYEDFCYDVLEHYKRGRKYGDSISLDKLAAMLGCRRKVQIGGGVYFQHLIKENPKLACEYLEGDILTLYEVAAKINKRGYYVPQANLAGCSDPGSRCDGEVQQRQVAVHCIDRPEAINPV